MAAERGLTVLFGGDVELARVLGQRLIKEPDYQPLAPIAGWLASADVRFVNLESPLSDQHGETQSPNQALVFNGPPAGARTLAGAGIDAVSTANNHAFDYGLRGLRETRANLAAAGVLAVGTGESVDEAELPIVLERHGFRLAIVAATEVWNQGPSTAARTHVAALDLDRLIAAIQRVRHPSEGQAVDAVAVSLHIGEEYQDQPLARTRALCRALVDAGADVVVGHHPHVPQGIEHHRGRPILYSLGNLVMRMHSGHPATGESFLARVRFEGGGIGLSVCPYRIVGHEPRPLAADGGRHDEARAFERRLRTLSAPLGTVSLGPWTADGCLDVRGP